MENLKESVKQIEMPEEMQNRILRNCMKEMELKKEKERMKKNFVHNIKKPAVIAATMAVCFCLTGITALAATGKLQGFLKDKNNWNGAVIGQTYEDATEELDVSTVVEGNVLAVTVTMLKPEVAPYSEIEELGLGTYQILDADGTVVVETAATEKNVVENAKITLSISVEQLTEETYKLVVSSFVGEKKADQPLEIKGNWECEFTR